MAQVSLHDVAVRFGKETALQPLSLQVDKGSWVGVIGPNGAGKSSMLRAVAGTVEYEGSVRIGDATLGDLSRRATARLLAMVPQSPVLPGDMTVFEYVLLGRSPYTGYFGIESAGDLEAAEAAIARLDLTSFTSRSLGTLSGGERQRAVFARALCQETGVLLLDEPTTALDVGRGQAALDLVDELRRDRGATVISSIHDLTLAAQYVDRLLLLVDGELIADGTPSEVLTVDSLRRFSGARVRVIEGPDGETIVVPRRE